ncbi:uncharacterized protein LOC122851010 [Aphidius gifuensis]|uniref:uncharacterized protein LOC122851010 n=1 Tax=Aphidius gifuensis TaxID=684658 RepID=UPI001CDCC835|nr:uncharacterized protein LOC122851010 [Aphidius gifuensis]
MTEYFTKFVLVFLFGIISSSSYSLDGFKNYKTISLKTQCGFNGDTSHHPEILQLGSMNDRNNEISASVFYSHWLAEIDHSHSTKSFKCTFTVKSAAPSEHIYATIQSMTFQSSPNGGCKDYIKFSEYNRAWSKHKSFCGKHQERKKALSLYQSSKYENFHDSNVIPESKHPSFDAENNELKVEIFISRDNIKKNLQNNLVVTFTPYKIYELWKNGKLCCNSNGHGISASESTVNLPNNIFFIEPENRLNILPSPSRLPSYESLFPNQSTVSLNTNENTTSTPTNSTAENLQIDATFIAIILLTYDCLKSHKAEEKNFMTLNQSEELVRKYQLGEKKIILDCIADGNPKPSIEWSHNGNEINWSSDKKFHLLNGSLEMIDLSNDDSGIYYCQASNGFQTKTIEYMLLAPFPENLNNNSLNISTEERAYNIFNDIIMHCLITGIKKPTITWYHNDTEINFLNKNKFILADGSLEIIDLSFKDAGYYKCKGFNEFGKQGLQYNLTVNPISYIKYRWIPSHYYKASPANYKLIKLDTSFQVKNKKKDEYYLGKCDFGILTSALVSFNTKNIYRHYNYNNDDYLECTHYQLLEVYGDYEWKSVINETIPSGAIVEHLLNNESIYIGKIERDNNYSVIINVYKNDTSVYYYPFLSGSAENRRYDNIFKILVVT